MNTSPPHVDIGVERDGRDVYVSTRATGAKGPRLTLRLPRTSMHALLACLWLVTDRDESPDHYELRLRGSLDART